MTRAPTLSQFKLEITDGGVAHLIFDAPERRFNVLSEPAIADLGRFAEWLGKAEVKGAVIRSGKAGPFCVGSDLDELQAGYDLVASQPEAQRDRFAFEHFFPLSRALRALECCGKPVAVAVGGLALGGGSELALACHYRTLADDPKAGFGQPEVLVGLAPGAGGTQRLPRLVGIARSLPVLLEGERIAGKAALQCGLVDQLVRPGDEVAAADQWVRSTIRARQPWDEPDFGVVDSEELPRLVAEARNRLRHGAKAHVPAPFAILDCVEKGVLLSLDDGIRIEMEIFARLIQKPEPRNVILTGFFGKIAYDRSAEAGELPAALDAVKAAAFAAAAAVSSKAANAGHGPADQQKALDYAGFTITLEEMLDGQAASEVCVDVPSPECAQPDRRAPLYWFEGPQNDDTANLASEFILAIAWAAASAAPGIENIALVDYALCKSTGYPEYTGGPLNLARQLGFAGETVNSQGARNWRTL